MSPSQVGISGSNAASDEGFATLTANEPLTITDISFDVTFTIFSISIDGTCSSATLAAGETCSLLFIGQFNNCADPTQCSGTLPLTVDYVPAGGTETSSVVGSVSFVDEGPVPVVPETPSVLLLGALGAVLFGGTALYARRRHRQAQRT